MPGRPSTFSESTCAGGCADVKTPVHSCWLVNPAAMRIGAVGPAAHAVSDKERRTVPVRGVRRVGRTGISVAPGLWNGQRRAPCLRSF
ncbi:hypothetical protein GCM10007918_06070 [Piscinibacter gummiphilus]|nr:hypothetical protein GCM10007918_06070 [Piscinibacter gummiphilus]